NSNNITLGSAMTGTGGFTKAGAGILTLSNASSTLSGGINITGGIISTTATLAGSTTVNLSNGGGLRIGGSSSTVGNPIALAAGQTGTLSSVNTANNFSSTIS